MDIRTYIHLLKFSQNCFGHFSLPHTPLAKPQSRLNPIFSLLHACTQAAESDSRKTHNHADWLHFKFMTTSLRWTLSASCHSYCVSLVHSLSAITSWYFTLILFPQTSNISLLTLTPQLMNLPLDSLNITEAISKESLLTSTPISTTYWYLLYLWLKPLSWIPNSYLSSHATSPLGFLKDISFNILD